MPLANSNIPLKFPIMEFPVPHLHKILQSNQISHSKSMEKQGSMKPVKEIVARVLRSNGGAHHRHIPCAAGYVTPYSTSNEQSMIMMKVIYLD